jgi:hypothetical protein
MALREFGALLIPPSLSETSNHLHTVMIGWPKSWTACGAGRRLGAGMRRVDITARSLAEAAALEALADVAHAVDGWDSVRIVGGQMVHIHTLLAGVAPRTRRTLDTDVVGTVAVIGSDALASRLLGSDGRGYERRDGSRIARRLPTGRDALIDLMVPSQTSAVRHNVRAGSFLVDAFPGLRTAIIRKPEIVDIHTTHLDGGTRAPFVVAVPDLVGALVVKALAAQQSARDRDRTDVEHLLQCAAATGVRLPPSTSNSTVVSRPLDSQPLREPSTQNLDYEKAASYLHGPFVSGRSATTARRRLVQEVVPYDPRPDPFLNL